MLSGVTFVEPNDVAALEAAVTTETAAIFLDAAPPADTLASLSGRVDEEVGLGRKEIYVSYGANMAQSTLKMPAAKSGTARNMNTVARLTSMALGL